ncbi:MAG: hypothetical protein HY791_37095 [Deltaproteobacteria bacterium]|nr:hypothetical protein [Deltaproteobacteria bacterium]
MNLDDVGSSGEVAHTHGSIDRSGQRCRVTTVGLFVGVVRVVVSAPAIPIPIPIPVPIAVPIPVPIPVPVPVPLLFLLEGRRRPPDSRHGGDFAEI